MEPLQVDDTVLYYGKVWTVKRSEYPKVTLGNDLTSIDVFGGYGIEKIEDRLSQKNRAKL